MAVTYPTEDTEQNARFTRMMRLGQVSYAEGNLKQAHRFWRRAAMMKPYDEQVWLALLNVVETDADKRVCLQNIITLNPNNVQAVQRLNAYYEDTQPSVTYIVPLEEKPRFRPLYVFLRLLEIAFMGGLLALALIIGRYIRL
jgi:hypothetical protein